MKKRFIDRDTWKHKNFRDMKGWAQLLHIHMYLELADFAGIAELDLHLASYNIKMMGIMPEDMDEIAKEIEPHWARVGESLFIKKNFLDETQGGMIMLTNPPHVCIFKDMHERWKHGLSDVVNIVLHFNPSIRFQSLQQAQDQIKSGEEELRKLGHKHKENGFKSRKKALDDARRYADVLMVKDNDLPCLVDADTDENSNRPGMHADQSQPIQVGVSQEDHNRAMKQGYYMLKNGQYTKPLLIE